MLWSTGPPWGSRTSALPPSEQRIGTPDDAIERINSLVLKCGGFGTFLLMATDTASWPGHPTPPQLGRARPHGLWGLSTRGGSSYELFAENVISHFRDERAQRLGSMEWIGQNAGEFFGGAMLGARQAAIDDYQPPSGGAQFPDLHG